MNCQFIYPEPLDKINVPTILSAQVRKIVIQYYLSAISSHQQINTYVSQVIYKENCDEKRNAF